MTNSTDLWRPLLGRAAAVLFWLVMLFFGPLFGADLLAEVFDS